MIIINNNVYDIHINDWEQKHPCGDIIKKCVGKDATTIFKNIHPEYAYCLFECLYVGGVE